MKLVTMGLMGFSNSRIFLRANVHRRSWGGRFGPLRTAVVTWRCLTCLGKNCSANRVTGFRMKLLPPGAKAPAPHCAWPAEACLPLPLSRARRYFRSENALSLIDHGMISVFHAQGIFSRERLQ